MKATKHGEERLKERTGNSKKNDRILKLALERGITHSQTTGKLNKYITSLYFYNKSANNIRIYQEKVFIFADDVLITVYHLPKEYKKLI